MLSRVKQSCSSTFNVGKRYFSSKSPKKGIIDRLKEGIVIGDGGFVFALEKIGYGNYNLIKYYVIH